MTDQQEKKDELKEYHIFISYRVASEAILAEKICDKVQQHFVGVDGRCRFRCFLDKQSLRNGESWKEQFLQAVGTSCLFLPLLSSAALSCFLEGNFNGDKPDNLLLEFERAIGFWKQKKTQIFPLFVGDIKDGAYQRFNQWGPYSKTPHLGGNSPAETLSALFGLQGSFVNPEEISEKIPIITSHFSERIWCLYRHLWSNKENLGPEKKFECVQCGELYLESENEESACWFHPDTKWGRYQCCNTNHKGCRRERHRSEHHNDYPYERKIKLVWSIVNYVNTHEKFLEVEAEYLGGSNVSILVGKTLGSYNFSKKLFIHAYDWFSTFDKQECAIEKSKFCSGDEGLVMEKTKKDGSKLAVSWFFPNNGDEQMYGLKLSCSTPSSQKDCIGEVTFRWEKDHVGDDIPVMLTNKMVQNGNFGEKRLHRKHDVVSSAVYSGKFIQEAEPLDFDKKPEDIYHTEDEFFCIKSAGKITANPRSFSDRDILYWPLTVVNLTSNPVLLSTVKGKWAHIGGEYQECEVELIATNEKHQINHRQPPQSSLPLKLEPLTPTNLVAKMSIVNKKRELVSFSFFDCAWIAAGCPLVVSLSFSTLPSVAPSEKWGGLGVVGTFTNPHCKMTSKRKNDDLFWMFLDHFETYKRRHLHVAWEDAKSIERGFRVSVNNHSHILDRKQLRQYCLQASKENKDVIPLEPLEGVDVSLAVDKEAGIAYAVVMEGETEDMKVRGVFALPEYYEVDGLTDFVYPCSPHQVTTNPISTGWSPLPDSVPVAPTPSISSSKYSPAPPPTSASSSSMRRRGGGEGEGEKGVEEMVGGMVGVLEKMSEKMDEVVRRLGALENKVDDLARKVDQNSQR